jgi:NADPH:quinone reductase-like Zn-dependent oxidoreductase
VIFDMVPTSSYAACIRSLRPAGRYLIGNPRMSAMLRSVLTSWLTDKTVTVAFARETKGALLTLRQMIDEGRIGPIVDRVYPMARAADAHRCVEAEQRVGAVVIAIGDQDGDSPSAASG